MITVRKLDFCLLLMDICVGLTVTLRCNGILPTSVKSSTSLLPQMVNLQKMHHRVSK